MDLNSTQEENLLWSFCVDDGKGGAHASLAKTQGHLQVHHAVTDDADVLACIIGIFSEVFRVLVDAVVEAVETKAAADFPTPVDEDFELIAAIHRVLAAVDMFFLGGVQCVACAAFIPVIERTAKGNRQDVDFIWVRSFSRLVAF